MKQSDDNKFIPMTSITGGKEREVKSDIYYFTNQIVNVVFMGNPAEGRWVLVDAGMPKSAKEIISVAESRFGKDNPPMAILLTHGHFDHVGSIVDLIEKWDVPVYAHPMEFPFLKGEQSYPEPDTSVQGGMLAKISSVYPHEPIDISEVLQALPEDQTVPRLPGWKWIHTPGHSPGHVAFYRESDKLLLPGDAFVSVKQDSMYRVLMQKKEINGPPRYLTTDWQQAYQSVQKLAALKADVAVPGHGPHMQGLELKKGLQKLVDNFEELAVPDYGKYVDEDKK